MQKTEVKTLFLDDFDVMRVCFTAGDRHGTNNRDQENRKWGKRDHPDFDRGGWRRWRCQRSPSAFRRWELRVVEMTTVTHFEYIDP